MEKTIAALRTRRGPEQLLDVESIVSAAQASASAHSAYRLAIDLPADDGYYDRLGRRPAQAPPWQVVAHLWQESPDAVPAIDSLLGADFELVHSWRVHEHVAWDHDPMLYDGSPSRGVKQISFVGKRADITDAEFAARYRDHVAIARVHHAGVRKYEQNVVARTTDDGTAPIAGVSEFWFRSVDDLIGRYYAYDDSSAITRADAARFLDPATTTWMLVQEYWIRS